MLWEVHAAVGSTGRFSRVVAGGRAVGLQARLVVLSCSDEKQWDGDVLGCLAVLTAGVGWRGVSVHLPRAF